jgi:transglutaminase-like putative cysteine protease
MRYDIIHRTVYNYDSIVLVSQHVARLTPRALPGQRSLAHELDIEPHPALCTHREDYFGNRAAFFSVASAHRSLVVVARGRVEVQRPQPPPPGETPSWETAREFCRADICSTTPEAAEFIFASPLVPLLPELEDYAKPSFSASRPLLDAVLDLTARIHKDFQFDPRATTVATPLEQVIKNRRGVCQDFAHFQIGCLRCLGLAARYVSGYMETLPPPGKTRLAGADASHAWVQVFIPPGIWIDVDPTNNLLPSDRHVLVAWGRDFDDVSPIRGVIVGGGKHELKVGVDVIPVQDSAGTSSP